MDQDIRQQRILDGVELVDTIGMPEDGRMCIMSLVAFMAGEGHTDRPHCASPLIACFAIPVNDNMPHDVRQRLKPFAPRIMGTNDGCDRQRTALLRRVLAEEIMPRVGEMTGRSAGRPARLRRLWTRMRRAEMTSRVRRLLRHTEEGCAPGRELDLAAAAGRLVTLCARDAAGQREAEWYWNAAIGLLDQLSSIGGEARPAHPVQVERLARLEEVLQARNRLRAGLAAPRLPFWSGIASLSRTHERET